MNRSLVFYLNAAGADWETLILLFLMSYRGAPRTVTAYSPCCLLHGREMAVSNTHNLRVKLSPEAKRLDEASPLIKLKSALSLANKTVREMIKFAHTQSERYYDSTAERRDLSEGDIVFLYYPVVKPNRSKYFAKIWKECHVA
jgi:hypothetical protein